MRLPNAASKISILISVVSFAAAISGKNIISRTTAPPVMTVVSVTVRAAMLPHASNMLLCMSLITLLKVPISRISLLFRLVFSILDVGLTETEP